MLDLITNRAQGDVTAARLLNRKKYADMTADEQNAFNAGLGAYRHTDLNRVGLACAEMYAALTDAGYATPGYTALKTDWTDSDRPTKAEFETYLATVASIKAALPAQTPIPSTMRRLTTDGANNIEKLLLEVEDILSRLFAIYIRSGTQYSGTQFYIAEAI